MDPVLCTVKFIWPQHGAKFVVKYPAREGKAEVFKCCTFARIPHPTPPLPHPPLRLNIDTCITSLNIVCKVSVQGDSIEARYKQLKFCF